ncbi:hypothetical protein L3X38_025295 [Prunus dulcis]|uniref:Uncharacterized protein n=1 Tax=Prunus dulcis TaxID=3755 RepID=A0AAD4W435_PRUDU|nr:hypothetical protein L3X38_025295 [Prunus dulcis]
MELWSARSWIRPGSTTLKSAGGGDLQVSVTQSQPEPQTGRIQGTVVSLIHIPDSHCPGVPETREADVKRVDKTEGKLDVRGQRHIRRQHIPKATWMFVDIVISEGNLFL